MLLECSMIKYVTRFPFPFNRIRNAQTRNGPPLFSALIRLSQRKKTARNVITLLTAVYDSDWARTSDLSPVKLVDAF
ncbi:hypothetical protein BSU04nite_20910 [Bacillus spizizenii]|nr:hypothetical protein BSU04nite_20910 [Bacillus spizizenii]